jgi:hypothetical protein
MGDLDQLVSLCKCGVFVSVNEHRDYYESVSEFLEGHDAGDIPTDVRLKMIERNAVVQVQFYPNTPIGSYVIFDYDLDRALKRALEILHTDASEEGGGDE